MNVFKNLLILFLALLWLFSCQPGWMKKAPSYDYTGMDKETKNVHKKVERFLARSVAREKPVYVHPATRIQRIRIDEEARHIDIELNKYFSFIPFREENVDAVYRTLYGELDGKYDDWSVSLRTLNQPIEALIPNMYRRAAERIDLSRMADLSEERPLPLVRNISKPLSADQGLYGHNIALWNSHGWYYNQYSRRWEWQRPRLFQTVEDLLPTSFVLPYLIPMLENAGANVFLPRERDIQTHEIIVDNDSLSEFSQIIAYSENRSAEEQSWFTGEEPAFGAVNPPYEEGINPFRLGTHRYTFSDTAETAHIDWIPHFPESGRYAVYISYAASPENVSDARYTVHHAGGQTSFLVNQQIGGHTWIYLGNFYFEKGFSPDFGKVVLSNQSTTAGLQVSADAVRFGGGMGVVARNGKTSRRPKFVEASRYYLQFAGMPDSLVYNLSSGKNDYTDDYQSRGEYVNYLRGAPFGPNRKRSEPGLGIPIDLSLAFHTDAGITRNDTTIGTLSIYSIEDADTQYVFPNGVSRLANRDFADILQTQIVDDLRQWYDPSWRRRWLMDAKYSEAFRPNVPSALLELLSHQNFLDMKFAMDPRFRFTASRSIYKSMLKFINQRHQKPYTVQPLPVTHFAAAFVNDDKLRLSWKPQTDYLEPTAMPDAYMLYTSCRSMGFDHGRLINGTEIILDTLKAGHIYRFKVTAVNSGGESFPSEILAACRLENDNPTVLIINGFDRICGPGTVENETFSGFFHQSDNGVPDRYDLNFTGKQFDFNPASPFRLNDAPGHGASFANYETTIIPGNTFDFCYVHGTSIKAAGYSFVSSSDEAVMDSLIDMNLYQTVDIILGEEKETGWQRPEMNTIIGKPFKTFPEKFKRRIRDYAENGGNLLISGAYVGTDLFENRDEEYPDILFAQQTLKFNWVTNHASRSGMVFSVGDSIFRDLNFQFNTTYHPDIYTVEAPDAIRPVRGALTILRYGDNGFSAGTAYKGNYRTLIMGFPFESILTQEDRDLLMGKTLQFFHDD